MAQNNGGFTLWLTGMACSGKSTLANYIAARLRQVGRNVEILDENEVADTLWGTSQETKEERVVAVRRLGFAANLLSRNHVATIVSAVSPYKGGREENRKLIPRYLEVYVDCPTEQLISRDSTGRYKKALSGEIPNFIGITEPYEPPNSPEVTIHSDQEPTEEGALKIFQALLDLGYLSTEDLKTITGKKMKANPVKNARRGAKPAAKPAPAAKPVAAAKGSKARPAARAARVAKPTKPTAKRKR
jgi:adenylylsulfate kinase